MAASTLTGTGGNFSATGFAAIVQSWRGTLQASELNTTGFGDAGWIDGTLINARFIGDAVGIISSAAAPIATGFNADSVFIGSAMEVAITLTIASGKTISFTGNVTAVELERAEEGQNNSVCRFRFASTGPVTQTWGA